MCENVDLGVHWCVRLNPITGNIIPELRVTSFCNYSVWLVKLYQVEGNVSFVRNA